MSNFDVLTIIGSILIPMIAGFAWFMNQIMAINARLAAIENRLTILELRMSFIEKLLEMVGIPMALSKTKINQTQSVSQDT